MENSTVMFTRCALALISLAFAGCFESHSNTAAIVRNRDCYKCHQAEYEQTGTANGRFASAPNHSALAADGKPICSTDCAACHTTQMWRNELGGCRHPDDAFPLITRSPTDRTPSPHFGMACADCHSAAISKALGVSSVDGKNTDCTSCHPSAQTDPTHQGVVGGPMSKIPGQPYAYSRTDHRFCLDCHPDGLVHGHGPTNPFQLPHRNATCSSCHDGTSGLSHSNGADTLCVSSGCHDGTGVNRAHCADTAGGQQHHPTCLNSGCHPDGRKRDGTTTCP